MINSKLDHCKTIEEFYKSIRSQQEKAHGDNYCAMHDAINEIAKDCKSYKELGVHQGGTLANALLQPTLKYVEGIDISVREIIGPARPSKPSKGGTGGTAGGKFIASVIEIVAGVAFAKVAPGLGGSIVGKFADTTSPPSAPTKVTVCWGKTLGTPPGVKDIS